MFGKDFHLDILLKAVKKAQPESLWLGAHHYVELSEYDIYKTITPSDVACVNKILPAGSAVPAICEKNLKQKFPNLTTIYNGYGQTEAGGISLGTENAHLGELVSDAQVKIVNPDHPGANCGPNEIGEICLKTPNMMLGYLNRPEETKKYFDMDGFGRSGDLGYYDKDGKIYYVDRIKELIK